MTTFPKHPSRTVRTGGNKPPLTPLPITQGAVLTEAVRRVLRKRNATIRHGVVVSRADERYLCTIHEFAARACADLGLIPDLITLNVIEVVLESLALVGSAVHK